MILNSKTTIIQSITSNFDNKHNIKISFARFPKWMNFPIIIGIEQNLTMVYLLARDTSLKIESSNNLLGSITINVGEDNASIVIQNINEWGGGMCISPFKVIISSY